MPRLRFAMTLSSCHSEERKRRGTLVLAGGREETRIPRFARDDKNTGGAIAGALLLLASVLALALPSAAKSWRVSDFQDTITVNPDGSALVNETITLDFEGE
jgi:hypothetical protein